MTHEQDVKKIITSSLEIASAPCNIQTDWRILEKDINAYDSALLTWTLTDVMNCSFQDAFL